MKVRHKWRSKSDYVNRIREDAGTTNRCLICRCLKIYEAGKVTYYLNGNTYIQSPGCIPYNINNLIKP